MKNSKFLAGTFFATALVFAVGCEDTSLEDLLSEGDAQVAENYMKTEASLNNLYSVVDVSLRDSLFQANDSAMVNGARVTRVGGDVLIDFGTGAIGSDGSTRKGMIKVTVAGDYMAAASLDIIPQSYSVDDKSVTGEINLDKVGADFALEISNFSAGHEVKVNANKVVSWKSGFATLNNSDDDVFDISGTSTGMDLTENRGLFTSITEAMNYDRSCEYKVVSGIIDLTLEADSTGKKTGATIDFLLDDACENLAKIKVTQGDAEVEVTKQFSGF